MEKSKAWSSEGLLRSEEVESTIDGKKKSINTEHDCMERGLELTRREQINKTKTSKTKSISEE